MKRLIVRSAYYSIGVSTLIAAVATEWDWLENPAGIFHDETGTNWPIVYDTAISWFLPSLMLAFALITTAAISFRLLRNSRRKRRDNKLGKKLKKANP